MRIQKWLAYLCSWSLCLGSVVGCGFQPKTALFPEKPSIEVHLNRYFFQPHQGFQIQHSLQDQTTIAQAVFAFSAELAAGEHAAYKAPTDFSIQLLAGSEGSYLNTNQDLAYAQVLMLYPDQSVEIFKGQASEDVFYFSGHPSDISPSETLLLVLDDQAEPQVIPGKISREKIVSSSQSTAPANLGFQLQIPQPPPPPPPPGVIGPPPVEQALNEPYHPHLDRLIEHFIELNHPHLDALAGQPRPQQWQFIQSLYQKQIASD